MAVRLLDLPTEIIGAIVADFEVEDIKSLRLTCRRMRDTLCEEVRRLDFYNRRCKITSTFEFASLFPWLKHLHLRRKMHWSHEGERAGQNVDIKEIAESFRRLTSTCRLLECVDLSFLGQAVAASKEFVKLSRFSVGV